MIGSVISVISLSWRYYNCPSLAALTRDNYNIVPRVIKLISPHHSCDNLYKCAVIKYKMCSDKALMNLGNGVNNSQPLCKLCIIFRILYRMFPQITGNTILEILDYKIFCGCMSRTPPLPPRTLWCLCRPSLAKTKINLFSVGMSVMWLWNYDSPKI